MTSSVAIAAYAGPNTSPKPYIVVASGPLSGTQLDQLRDAGATVTFTYRYLPGAAIQVSPTKVGAVQALPFVTGVFTDGVATADAVLLESALAVPAATDHTYNLDLINAEPADVSVTGQGVYVAVLDTGLIADWRSILPEARVAANLGVSFVGANGVPNFSQWEQDTGSHGTAVAATIVGYTLVDDSAEGGILHEPLTGDPQATTFVRGVAPDATIVPVKVLSNAGSGFFSAIIAGIDYVTFLVSDGPLQGSRIVINMSLGGPSPSRALERSIDRAIEQGVVVVASAGNEGTAGMGWPGAYPQVLSAGAIGFIHSFGQPSSGVLPSTPDNAWWSNADVPERKEAKNAFIASFSSRENPALGARFTCEGGAPCVQDLDVVAPGRRVLLPFPCSNGVNVQGACGALFNNPADPFPAADSVPPTYLFVSGTSFSSPHTAGVVALLLEDDPTLTPSEVESILTGTAAAMAPSGAFLEVNAAFTGFNPHSWNDAVQVATGSGIVDAKAALRR